MATTPVRALTIRCVGNAGELRTALGEANAADADSPFLIQLRTGTYVNDGGAGASFEVLPHRAGQIVELSGGWEGANGSCQSRSYGPLRTVLKGTANRPALYFLLSSAGLQAGQLHLHDVDVTNPVFSEENNGACLRGVVQAGNAALIERVTARQCNAPYGAHASMKISNSGELTVRDVSVHSGTAKNNGGIGILTSEGGISRLAQISVTATQSSEDGFLGSGIALLNFGNAITHLSNSVTWGNDPDTDDLWLNGDGIVLTRVHYGRLSGTPAGNLVPGSGDPGFTAAGDARLRPDSALIDSGVSDPEGGSGLFDVDGNSRVRGAAVDVGAHEAAPPPDPIFHDGFDQGLD
jgi:hypothetical protein